MTALKLSFSRCCVAVMGLLLASCATFNSAPLTFAQLGSVKHYAVNDSSVRLTFKQLVQSDIDADDVALLHAALLMQNRGYAFFAVGNVSYANTSKTEFRPYIWSRLMLDMGAGSAIRVGLGYPALTYSQYVNSPYWWHGPWFDPYWGADLASYTVQSLPVVSMTITGFASQDGSNSRYNTQQVVSSLSAIYRAPPPVVPNTP